MNRWFRFYSDAMRNPKVARLSDADFRLWVKLLAVASDHDGEIPPVNDLKLLLNVRLDHLSAGLKRLISGGLIDLVATGYEPHHWSKFQYKSDTSRDRVAKHRSSRNVTVTPPDPDTDSEKKEAIADAMDGKPSNAMMEAPANLPAVIDLPAATIEPVDLKRALFTAGVPYLVRHGTAERTARAMLGKWRQQYGDGAVLDALHLAQSEACSDPIPMITKILERRNGGKTRSGSSSQFPQQDGTDRPHSPTASAAIRLRERFGTAAAAD